MTPSICIVDNHDQHRANGLTFMPINTWLRVLLFLLFSLPISGILSSEMEPRQGHEEFSVAHIHFRSKTLPANNSGSENC
jgi:hypothetical protein